MDSRKMTLVATILAIALLAVGIGYAYTAITTNSGNTVNAEYITLTQNGDAAYTFTDDEAKVYWDSDNKRIWVDDDDDSETPDVSKIQTKYTISDTTVEVPVYGVTYKAVALASAPIQIVATPQSGGTASAALNCTFETTGFDYDADAVFIVAFSDAAAMTSPSYALITDDDAWSDNQFTIGVTSSTYNTKYVQIYYACKSTGIVVTDGDRDPPAVSVLNGASIKFTARTPTLNGDTVQLTSISLTGTATVAVEATTTITATPNDGASLPGAGTWTSLNTGIATVNASGVVTGAAAGHAFIVYTSSDGKFSECIDITVTAP